MIDLIPPAGQVGIALALDDFYRLGGDPSLLSKLLERSVTEMSRISDARMSGTAFGTVVLHVSPESDAGGGAIINFSSINALLS